LVDSSEGNTVDFMGSGDQEKSGLQLLKENNSLAFVSTDKEDKDLTSFDILSESGGLVGSLNSASGVLLILSRVPLGDSSGLGSV